MPQSRGRRHKPGEKARERARARRTADRNPADNYWVCMQFGAVADIDDAESVEEVKQVTHDRVIAQTADMRASGVQWRIIPAASNLDDCRQLIMTAGDGSEAAVKARDGLVEFLTSTPSAGLVVASCQVLRGQDRNRAHLS